MAQTQVKVPYVESYDYWDRRGFRDRQPNGETAVTSYRFTVFFRVPGQDAILSRFRTTNVWMRRPEGWQVVAAHTHKLGGLVVLTLFGNAANQTGSPGFRST